MFLLEIHSKSMLFPSGLKSGSGWLPVVERLTDCPGISVVLKLLCARDARGELSRRPILDPTIVQKGASRLCVSNKPSQVT